MNWISDMTEMEKCRSGYLYLAYEDSINAERIRSQELSYEYNLLRPSQRKEKEEILRREMKKVGKNIKIEPPFQCDFWRQVSIGDNFFANYNFVLLAPSEVVIGNDVLIGPNVGIYAAGHAFDATKRNEGLEYSLPVHIGNSVWIGGHTCIVSGVTIGDNTIIAAGSVVIHDVPSGVLAGGNPCRVIRKIQTSDDRKFCET